MLDWGAPHLLWILPAVWLASVLSVAAGLLAAQFLSKLGGRRT